MNKIIKIEKSGVVEMLTGHEPTFSVNQDDMVTELAAAVGELRPKTDYNGKFAARVCVEIELLGDSEDGNEA